jgi:hypothetical protein
MFAAGVKAQNKIPLGTGNIINISTWGNAGLLLDEQDYVGDPSAGGSIVPRTKFSVGYQHWKYPISVIIDLQGIYNLTDIYLFDSNGSGEIEVYAGTPMDWELLFSYGQNRYNSWAGFQIEAETRYVLLKMYAADVFPSEIVIYGNLAEEVNEIEQSTAMPKPLISDFVGVNAFINDPIEFMDICGFVREYHDWSFTEVEADLFEFNRWNGYWDFDKYYQTAKEKNVEVSPCLQNASSFHTSAGRNKPLIDGQDSLDPLSYYKHAQLMYQYAARYGNVAVDERSLLLNTGQEAKTGLGYLRYYESWNEQDRWWEGKNGWFSPFEYSAMLSAAADGHLGQLGAGYGIKSADPGAKMVMGGLASLDLEYLKSMILWAKYARGGDFPADVINLHHYSNDLGGQGNSNKGVSPEDDKLKERIRTIADFRDNYLPGKELWITEFGYDTHPESRQRAEAYADYTANQVQAMWLIRSYLAILAGGADRAAMYMVRNVDNNAQLQYSTSGLVTDRISGSQLKKDSWYYLSAFYNQLKTYRYSGEIESGNENVLIYAFTDEATGNEAMIAWRPTSDGTKVSGFQLDLGGIKRHAYAVNFANGELLGSAGPNFENVSSITIDITEMPVIIKTERAKNQQQYALNQGWNLISFNSLDADMSPDAVFGNSAGNIVSVKNADKHYLPRQAAQLNSLKELSLTSSYLVKALQDTVFSYGAEAVWRQPVPLELKKGWNFLPMPYLEKIEIKTALASIWDKIEALKDFDKYYIRSSETGTMHYLEPKKGYFLKTTESCTLIWPAADLQPQAY